MDNPHSSLPHSSLRRALNLSDVQEASDSESYLRGLNFPQDKFRDLNETDTAISATVDDNGTHHIELFYDNGTVEPDCDCDSDWAWCKHAVALAAMLYAPTPTRDDQEAIDDFIAEHDRDALVLLIRHLSAHVPGVVPELTRLAHAYDADSAIASKTIGDVINDAIDTGQTWEDILNDLEAYADTSYVAAITPYLEKITFDLSTALGEAYDADDGSEHDLETALAQAIELHASIAGRGELDSPDLIGWLTTAYFDFAGFAYVTLSDYADYLSADDLSRLYDELHRRQAAFREAGYDSIATCHRLFKFECELAILSDDKDAMVDVLLKQQKMGSLIEDWSESGGPLIERDIIEGALQPPVRTSLAEFEIKSIILEYFGHHTLIGYLEPELEPADGNGASPDEFYSWLSQGARKSRAETLITRCSPTNPLVPSYWLIIATVFYDSSAVVQAFAAAERLGQSPTDGGNREWATLCAHAMAESDPDLACVLFIGSIEDQLETAKQSHYIDAAESLAALRRDYAHMPQILRQLDAFVREIRQRYARRTKMLAIFDKYGLP